MHMGANLLYNSHQSPKNDYYLFIKIMNIIP